MSTLLQNIVAIDKTKRCMSYLESEKTKHMLKMEDEKLF